MKTRKGLWNSFFLLMGVLLMALILPALTFAGTKTLTFAWNQDISPGFAGWKLYRDTLPNVQPLAGKLFATIPFGGSQQTEYQTSQSITSPDNAEVTYYFVLTAFDTSGNESAKSNEVFAIIDFQSPGVPIQLKVTVTTP